MTITFSLQRRHFLGLVLGVSVEQAPLVPAVQHTLTPTALHHQGAVFWVGRLFEKQKEEQEQEQEDGEEEKQARRRRIEQHKKITQGFAVTVTC